MLEDYTTLIYVGILVILVIGFILVIIKKRKQKTKSEPRVVIQRKVPDNIEELYEEYEEPTPEPEPVKEIKKKKPKKPISLLDQDFEF
jgi:hypothetical protein